MITQKPVIERIEQMKNIKIIAPVKKPENFAKLKNLDCNTFYVYHHKFLKNNFEYIKEYINEAHRHNCEIYVNFKHNIGEDDIEEVKAFLKYLISTEINGILVNSYGLLELIKTIKLPFKVIVDSYLDIHNLAGIEFVNLFHPIDMINITEDIYLKNLSKIRKYTKQLLSIDTDNLPWCSEEIKKSKVVDAVIIKGKFATVEEIAQAIDLIERIIDKPKVFKNQKLPFKHVRKSFYQTNHFSGEMLSAEGKDFTFSGNIQNFNWEYKKTILKKNTDFSSLKIPKLNLKLASFEHIKMLKNYIKKNGFNPVYSIEYGEILSTTDLAKNSFNDILVKIKHFCLENNINLQLSTPRILIERDFDRVYEYVKLLCTNEPYPNSLIVNNIGYWWTVINDNDFEKLDIELGNGLNLLCSGSILCLANQRKVSTVDLSNIKDIKEIEKCIKKIKNKVPTRKLTVGGSIRVPSLGLCPLNNDSAIISRLSCKAPCHKGPFAVYDPSLQKKFPFTVDGFCRMHMFREEVLDLFKYINYLQKIGINEFVIDFNGLDAKLIPVLLNRFLNSIADQNYKPDKNFLNELYMIKQ